MIFGITYIQWLFIAFFIIISTMLVINILIINKLKDDKNKLKDNEELLTHLLSQIQNYFSKIDNSINNVASEEHQLHEMFDMHQKDENEVLKALELNQTLFLDRMDKIVNIQQELSTQMKNGSGSSISPEMIRMADNFMAVQKRDMSHVKNRLDSLIGASAAINQSVNDASAVDVASINTLLQENLSNYFYDVNKNIQTIKDELVNNTHGIKESDKEISEAMINIDALTQHIEIAKRNIQSVIEQSIDLNPIYKSVHELIEQIKTIFSDYHLAKGEIQKLIQSLQAHEHKDLIELKGEVEHFLKEIKDEMKSSVEMLKQEYHIGQNQVTGTVKTLSDRSMANLAYQDQQE